jgi:glycosyltransferase involved in cell wall biosynthesis
MEERKDWVIYHGATQQDELMREFKGAAYCIQPSDWIETSMISAIERLSCGVYQIIRGVGGCIDTLKEANEQGMAKIVYSDCITEAEHDLYAAEVIQAIEEKAYQRVSVDPKKFAWENVAKEWLTDLPRLAGLELSATG